MLWFKHTAQITALQQEIELLKLKLTELECFIHSDAFHELLTDGVSLEDRAQEALERVIENADVRLHVRF